MPAPSASTGTSQDKEYDRQVASLRAPVEHVIAQLKNWKILAKDYRGRFNELPLVISVVTRLELLRIGWRKNLHE